MVEMCYIYDTTADKLFNKNIIILIDPVNGIIYLVMYHFPPRNVLIARKLLAWFISLIAVIVGVVIVTALTLGYSYNENDGKLERGGIMQISSRPSGASVTVNGIPHSSNTPTKLVSTPGEYAIKMERAGYRTWQKTVPIQAGNITWETYARLFPQNVNTTNVATFDSLSGALPSGNSKYYAFLEEADSPTVTIAQLDSSDVEVRRVILPEDLFTESTGDKQSSSFKLFLWSGNQKYLLMKHEYSLDGDNHLEWVLVNTSDPTDSVNINTSYGIDPDDIIFGDSDGRELIVLVDGVVRWVKLDNQTLSRPLAQNVNNFRLYGSRYIFFVSNPLPDKTQKVGYVRDGFSEPVVISTIPYDGSNTGLVDVEQYFNEEYMLVSNGNMSTLYEMKGFGGSEDDEIELETVADMPTPHTITDLDISSNGQLATVQDGYNLVAYDLEINKKTITVIESDSAEPQTLQHLDTYLYWGYNDGHMRTYEFDGANQYNLMQFNPRFKATFSPSGKYLYSVIDQGGQYHLQRIQMYD